MRDPKKKILFLMPYLGCGGVESTLFSLLEVLDKEKYEVTLLLLEKKGDFADRIPHWVKVRYMEIPEREWGIFFGKKKMLMSYIKAGRLWKIPGFLRYNRKNSITEDRTQNAAYFKRISSDIPVLSEEYDLAIDYFGYATFTTFYLAEKVAAKVKVSWLHSILSRFEPRAFAQWYEKMDTIFACSKMVQTDFETVFPHICRVLPFYNIIFPEKLRALSAQGEGFQDNFPGIRILTVGRICHEKGTDLAIKAYQRLIAEGHLIRWYWIGGGSEQDMENAAGLLRTEQEKENMVFLGVRRNPYVYMAQCDIYVQPSRYEGYCTTTNEARILGCPIVTTDVSGAREQIVDGETGMIVETAPDAICQAVKALTESPELREKFARNVKEIHCDTRKEVEKLYALMEN